MKENKAHEYVVKKKKLQKAAGDRIITTGSGEMAPIKQPIKPNVQSFHLQGKPPTITMGLKRAFTEQHRSS